jgi:hypothetical protein
MGCGGSKVLDLTLKPAANLATTGVVVPNLKVVVPMVVIPGADLVKQGNKLAGDAVDATKKLADATVDATKKVGQALTDGIKMPSIDIKLPSFGIKL